MTELDEPLYRVRVRSPIAPMHCEPQIASQMVSQQLAGHCVEVVDEEGDWVRARGADDYEGWIHRGFVDTATDQAPGLNGDGLVSLGCATLDPTRIRRALPLRAILAAGESIVEGEALGSDEITRRFPLEGEAVARSAREFFRGTSYLWGGVTPWGADCSGLVQTAFALHGLQLPRDAWQQAALGAEVTGGMAAWRAGDLLCFTDRQDRHITHVAVVSGPGEIVHLSLGRGGYALEMFGEDASGDDRFLSVLRERFVVAKRLI